MIRLGLLHFMYRIYVLIDPRTNEVKYVGITKRTLEARLTGHLVEFSSCSEAKRDWVMGLLAVGLRPIIKEIEKTHKEIATARESYWIHYYIKQGASILNLVAIDKKMTPIMRYRLIGEDISSLINHYSKKVKSAPADSDKKVCFDEFIKQLTKIKKKMPK